MKGSDGVNTIKIGTEEANQILNTYTQKDPKTMYEDNFIFDEFGLHLGKWVKLLIKAKGNKHLEISGVLSHSSAQYMGIEFLVIMDNLQRHVRLFPKNDTENIFISKYGEDIRQEAKYLSEWVFIIVFHIMNYPRDRKQTRVSSHKYSREYRLSTKQNRIYLFSDILKYVSDTYVPEGQHHSIQCPCWEVRGHYRHYKSGKVVFIPAYKKGKQRDKAEPKPKEYYV